MKKNFIGNSFDGDFHEKLRIAMLYEALYVQKSVKISLKRDSLKTLSMSSQTFHPKSRFLFKNMKKKVTR